MLGAERSSCSRPTWPTPPTIRLFRWRRREGQRQGAQAGVDGGGHVRTQAHRGGTGNQSGRSQSARQVLQERIKANLMKPQRRHAGKAARRGGERAVQHDSFHELSARPQRSPGPDEMARDPPPSERP